MPGNALGGGELRTAEAPDMSVQSEIAAGRDVRVRPLARQINLPASTLYAQIARGEIEARKIGRCVVVANAAARRVLGMVEAAA